jgi:hypothetical protein
MRLQILVPSARRYGSTVRPARARWAGRRRAAGRIAPAAPRSAGPGPGRARSPPDQRIEHEFESGSGTLRSPPGPLRAWVGRAGAATRRNLGDTKGQQETTNVEVSSGFAAIGLGREIAGLGFHTAEITGSCKAPPDMLKAALQVAACGGRPRPTPPRGRIGTAPQHPHSRLPPRSQPTASP